MVEDRVDNGVALLHRLWMCPRTTPSSTIPAAVIVFADASLWGGPGAPHAVQTEIIEGET
ncbi:hypothetical protein [Streptomyces sp. NBC_00038]|uniref:hypothetical protein n=1 Tax=Streptomyces sp. NBC_00038 TaxID=2903615 RepID=UPI00224FD6BC|nr:hypothetical protein [Streptomyces sp. NBC_00038]MCX5558255.1 hypothetical protein [Streptomyces sp. NBC_00038]